MEKDKRLIETFWWERLTEGKLVLVLMGRAMLSKSLIQISVDGWSCVPSLLFTWGQTMMEVMKTMVTTLKRSHACTSTLSAPNPAEATTSPRLHWRLLDTTSKSGSVSWGGHCSFLLGSGAQGSVCALKVSIFQSCVSSGSSMVELMVTSSKRAYAIPRSAAPRAPIPVAVLCWAIPPQEMLKHKHSSVSLCGVHESWCAQGLLEPS